MPKSIIFCLLLFFPIVVFTSFKKKDNAGKISETKFDYVDGKILIKVSIGNQFYTFVFDSGAMSILSEDLANKLSAEKLPTNMKGTDANGREESLALYRIKHIKLDRVKFENPVFATANFNEINKLSCTKIDGIFGANMMDHLVWQIDFSNRTITLYTKPIHHSSSELEIPFTKDTFDRVPHTTATINDQKQDFTLDLGSGSPIAVQRSQISLPDSQMLCARYEYQGTSLFTTAQQIDTTRFYRLNARIGQFNADVIVRTERECLNQIGTGFFENYVTTFDFIDNILYLNQSTKRQKVFSARNMSVGSYGDSVIVVGISSDFTSNKLKLGERVYRINGYNADSMHARNPCALNELLKGDNLLISNAVGEQDSIFQESYPVKQ